VRLLIDTNILDFDDAYQYALAEKHDLIIVSFDSDFDKTGSTRLNVKSRRYVVKSQP